jgi:L-alanine-DL-glutamate epimerase-like enolase superfamily enzyme
MKIESAELHFLEIPFRLSISHGARAGRTYSDSLVLKIDCGGAFGFGEAVARDYVSGVLGSAAGFRDEAAQVVTKLLATLRGRPLTWEEAAGRLAAISCAPPALPLLCAVESALLSAAAAETGTDPWSVLGMEPVRPTVVYGGVLPMLPLESARAYVEMCAALHLADLKVKVGADQAYNESILALCRGRLGDSCDIRVDANSAWTSSDADAQGDICARHGIQVIEQPFPVAAPETDPAAARLVRRGFIIMADEGVLTGSDVRSLAASGLAQVLNLRLSKNGGLMRLLSLAREAEACGLTVQLGCMVGETGILSCMGRLAASLLPRPLYVEGSYDDLLLEQNITRPSFGFGPGGAAPILRGTGMGYLVDEERLAAFSRETRAV